MQELSLQLSEVHSASTGTDDLLEQETIERLRLEEELEKSRVKLFMETLGNTYLLNNEKFVLTFVAVYYQLHSVESGKFVGAAELFKNFWDDGTDV